MLDILDIPNTFLKSLFSSGTTFFIHRCSVLIAQPHLALDASRHIRASLGAAKPHNPNPTEKATDTRHASNSPHSPHSSHGQFARPGPGPAPDRPAGHMESLGILGPSWPSPPEAAERWRLAKSNGWVADELAQKKVCGRARMA